jgi:hypothetical protein
VAVWLIVVSLLGQQARTHFGLAILEVLTAVPLRSLFSAT